MATNGNFALQDQYKSSGEPYAATPATGDATNTATANSNLSKDEVAWYFVEQYYTTLSKSPEKLHLFYGKRSQFVYGMEAEVANVSVGRQAIQERIKLLDFQDCKVRISNVDSQASFDNIVIQVIGETSNKAAEPKKYVQTFVLAQQPSGYFVLNDILRYIDEEGTDELAETAAAPEAHGGDEPTDVSTAEDAPLHQDVAKEESSDLDASAVNQKLEKVSQTDAKVNGDETHGSTEPTQAFETQVEEVYVVGADAEMAAQELAEEDATEAEKPQDPTPTPVSVTKTAPLPQPALQPQSESAAPAAPAAPSVAPAPVASEPAPPPKPMTWASRAAAAAGPRPVVPLPKTATPPAQNQSRAPNTSASSTTSAPAPAPGPAPATAATAAVAPAASQTPTQQSGTPLANTPVTASGSPGRETSGWQTAGADSRRQNRPHSMSGNFGEKDGTMAYVKYVTDKVVEADLRNELAIHGELTYFDINRQKNCAFVEYKTIEGYQSALTKNPHVVNGESIIVEPRRPKATAYGGSNYAGRGNASGRARGGFDGNRNGGHGGSRGSFSGQSRGRGGMPRGRGGIQTNIV